MAFKESWDGMTLRVRESSHEADVERLYGNRALT